MRFNNKIICLIISFAACISSLATHVKRAIPPEAMPLIFNGLVAVTNQLLSTHGRDSGQTDNTVPLLSSNGNEYEDPGPSNQVPPQHRDLVVRLLDTIKGVWSRMKNGTMQRFNKNGHSTTDQENNLATGQENNLATGQENNLATGQENNLATGQENNLATGQENNLATSQGNNLATDPDTSDSGIS